MFFDVIFLNKKITSNIKTSDRSIEIFKIKIQISKFYAELEENKQQNSILRAKVHELEQGIKEAECKETDEIRRLKLG